MANLKTKLSATMLALIAAGSSAPVLMEQFQKEKEGTSLIAYQDQGGVWTICGGVTYVNGKPVFKDMKLTRIRELQQQVMSTWPVEAIGKADTQIKVLSGMMANLQTTEQEVPESEDTDSAGETAEKR